MCQKVDGPFLPLGTLDEERWRDLVKALGNMMGSECEPA